MGFLELVSEISLALGLAAGISMVDFPDFSTRWMNFSKALAAGRCPVDNLISRCWSPIRTEEVSRKGVGGIPVI
ncbi:hypothetical protein chiPu_0027096 [Chiloscyllium punctatum]|uniref:Uncharacterized protein n=1 Tax=Chiloscyllium punctatum TaxID=137246 RepID=A0A401TKR7_CHIPU|nr:hypothetical protein [Chiloscyllium punctatum]